MCATLRNSVPLAFFHWPSFTALTYFNFIIYAFTPCMNLFSSFKIIFVTISKFEGEGFFTLFNIIYYLSTKQLY